jgi:hypothetical protein
MSKRMITSATRGTTRTRGGRTKTTTGDKALLSGSRTPAGNVLATAAGDKVNPGMVGMKDAMKRLKLSRKGK